MTTDNITMPRKELEKIMDALFEVDQNIELRKYCVAPPNVTLLDYVLEAITAGRAALDGAKRVDVPEADFGKKDYGPESCDYDRCRTHGCDGVCMTPAAPKEQP